MNEQTEKLREKIANTHYRRDYINKGLKEFVDLPVYLQNLYLAEADDALLACKEEGLVFKVDREVPELPKWTFANIGGFKGVEGLITLVRQDMLKAGYVATEEIDIE